MTEVFQALGLLSKKTLGELWECGDTKIDEEIKAGLLPKPIELGPRMRRFLPAEIAAIRQARIEGSTDDEIRALVKRLEAARKVPA